MSAAAKIPVGLNDLHRLDSLLSALHHRYADRLPEHERDEVATCMVIVRRLTDPR